MRNKTLSIAVLSGKGGVGKSNIALNLGYCLHEKKKKVLMMDCDIGLANIDILLGISPEYCLQNIIFDKLPVKDSLVSINNGIEPAFDLIASNSGMSGLTELDKETRHLLAKKINPVAQDYDFVFLDISAGITPTALNMSARADIRLLILTPEPTPLTDSYALIKVMANEYNIKDFHIVVNMADSMTEATETFKRISMVCEKFLNFTPKYLGNILNDNGVPHAVATQKPLVVHYPKTKASKDLHLLADDLLKLAQNFPKDKDQEALKLELNISSEKKSFF